MRQFINCYKLHYPSVGLLLLIGKKLILINYSIVIYKTYSPPPLPLPYLVTDSMLKLQEVHVRKCYGSKIILKHNLHISSTLLYNKPSIPSSRRSRLKQKFTSKSKYDDSFSKIYSEKIRIINRNVLKPNLKILTKKLKLQDWRKFKILLNPKLNHVVYLILMLI